MFANPGCRLDCSYFVAVRSVIGAWQRADIRNLRLWEDLRAVLFSQIQVTKVKGVLGAETTTHHAAAAAYACGACGALAAEIRVREGFVAVLVFGGLKDTDVG